MAQPRRVVCDFCGAPATAWPHPVGTIEEDPGPDGRVPVHVLPQQAACQSCLVALRDRRIVAGVCLAHMSWGHAGRRCVCGRAFVAPA
jgi:hypothetical protein